MTEIKEARLTQSIIEAFGLQGESLDPIKIAGVSDRLLSFRSQDFATGLAMSILSILQFKGSDGGSLTLEQKVQLRDLLETMNMTMAGFGEDLSKEDEAQLREFAKGKQERMRQITPSQMLVVRNWLAYIKERYPEMAETVAEAQESWGE